MMTIDEVWLALAILGFFAVLCWFAHCLWSKGGAVMVTITLQEWEHLGDLLLHACGVGSFLGCCVFNLARLCYWWIEGRFLKESDK